MALVRTALGEALRRRRLTQERTLRDVSHSARVSLGYLSEIERGQKEASSELLAAICQALCVPLSALLREVSDQLAVLEGGPLLEAAPAPVVLAPPRPAGVVDRAA
jgi:transcriptional regulator with XRE-family HTH domain